MLGDRERIVFVCWPTKPQEHNTNFFLCCIRAKNNDSQTDLFSLTHAHTHNRAASSTVRPGPGGGAYLYTTCASARSGTRCCLVQELQGLGESITGSDRAPAVPPHTQTRRSKSNSYAQNVHAYIREWNSIFGQLSKTIETLELGAMAKYYLPKTRNHVCRHLFWHPGAPVSTSAPASTPIPRHPAHGRGPLIKQVITGRSRARRI